METNVETLMIKDVIPGKASENTLTPNRKFLQVVFKPVAEEGFLVTKRIVSRNFWSDFIGAKVSGGDLNLAADQLFLSICEACDITASNIDNVNWEPGSSIFEKVIGMKVRGLIATEYVEAYSIPNSLSKLSVRYRYTTLVLDGETVENVFKNQGHIIIQNPQRLQEVKERLSEIATINQAAREERQHERGIPTASERIGTSALTTEKTLSGSGSPSVLDHKNPSLNKQNI